LRILITGASGFAGFHLTQHILQTSPHDEVHGTCFSPHDEKSLQGAIYHILDLRNPNEVDALIEAVKPDQIYHLAAQAMVKQSFADPWATLETNIRSEVNLLQSCLKQGLRPRFIIVSTGELYANASLTDRPSDETIPPQPTSPYSVSKVAQELLGIQYHSSRNIPAIVVRPFNQMGPGQREGFVAPDFAMQIARIEAGLQPPEMRVGNLEARRDFSDVRDVARAKVLLMTHGEAGQIYNIASGRARSIQEILDFLLSQSKVSIKVTFDPERMRPANVPLLWGDPSKLQKVTGWQPEISFEQSLTDVLDDCRQRVKASQ
jgi:GDP-4-dehydro-6-deoxy-D-mannose reductase